MVKDDIYKKEEGRISRLTRVKPCMQHVIASAYISTLGIACNAFTAEDIIQD